MSFSFGTPKADGAPSFNFGSAAGDAKGGTPQKPAFGTPTTQPTAGFKAPVSTFTLGGAGTPNAGLNFGGAAPAAVSFNLGGMSSGTAAPAQGLSFGTPAATAPAPAQTGFGFGKPLATATPVPATTAPSVLNFGLGSTTTTSTTAFSLGGPVTTTTAVATSTTPSLGFSLGSTPAKTGTGLTFGTPTLAASLAAPVASSAPTFALGAATAAATSTAPTLSSTASVIPTTGSLTFSQLEEAINKWTIDLDDQGKLFSNQAKQLNAWDRLLITNGEKVLTLNNGIERVKQQQQQLDQELDFVLAQQKELEDLIIPLEKELNDVPVTDLDRNNTYQLAENMDTQLKQMSEDLKEIIEQLNETNKSQEMSNPITQIGKILNAHMNSLQWIDRHTNKISTHLDQISKMSDMNRRNHEKSFQRSFE